MARGSTSHHHWRCVEPRAAAVNSRTEGVAGSASSLPLSPEVAFTATCKHKQNSKRNANTSTKINFVLFRFVLLVRSSVCAPSVSSSSSSRDSWACPWWGLLWVRLGGSRSELMVAARGCGSALLRFCLLLLAGEGVHNHLQTETETATQIQIQEKNQLVLSFKSWPSSR